MFDSATAWDDVAGFIQPQTVGDWPAPGEAPDSGAGGGPPPDDTGDDDGTDAPDDGQDPDPGGSGGGAVARVADLAGLPPWLVWLVLGAVVVMLIREMAG